MNFFEIMMKKIIIILSVFVLLVTHTVIAETPNGTEAESRSDQRLGAVKSGINKTESKTIIDKIEFDDMFLADVVRFLSEHSGMNVVTTPDASSQKINTYLQNVDVKQAVEMIAKSHGLWYREEPKNNAIRIMTVQEYQDDLVVYRDDETKVFDLLNANVQDMAQMVADVFGDRVRLSLGRRPGNDFNIGNTGDDEEGESSDNNNNSRNGTSNNPRSTSNTVNVPLKNSVLDEIDETVTNQFINQSDLNDKGAQEAPISVTVNNEHNLLIVRTSDRKALDEISVLIDTMNRPVPQVLLEMKILEVQIGDDFRSIFDLQTVFGSSVKDDEGTTIAKNNSSVGLGNFLSEGGGLIYKFLDETLSITLEILLSQNRVNVVSTPIVLASNHRETELFLGEETVLTTGFTSAGGENNNSNGDVVSNVVVAQTEKREIGNRISLTPRINADGTVNIELLQDSSTVKPNGAKTFVSDGSNLVEVNIDTVNTSRVEGTFMAQNGKTVVIGGLIRDDKGKSVNKVPVLGDIPVLGWLFRREAQLESRSELVLLITPHVVYNASQAEQVSKRRIIDESRFSEWPTEQTPPEEIKPFQKPPKSVYDELKLNKPKVTNAYKVNSIEAKNNAEEISDTLLDEVDSVE